MMKPPNDPSSATTGRQSLGGKETVNKTESIESAERASGSLERMFRRMPVTLLCSVAHMTGFGVALTIGKDFWPYILCAMTGMVCIVIALHHDYPPTDEFRRTDPPLKP